MQPQGADGKEGDNSQYKKVDDYVISSAWKIGSGSFSEVYKAVDTKDNSKVALKVIKLQGLTSKVAVTLLQQQIGVLNMISHPNVIKCHKILNSSNHCYIVTQFCKFGDLDKLLKMKKKFTEVECAPYIYQIYQGLRYLSDNQIVHRDLKPANILVSEGATCKISDFGFAIKNEEGQVFKDIGLGSPIYMAPETIHMRQYGPKTDVWAFGCLIYELLCGHPPLYQVKTPEELKQKVLCPPPPLPEPVSPQLGEFLNMCLTVQEKYRISFQEMQSTPYMRKVFEQFQEVKLSQELSQTGNSTKSSKMFLNKVLKYELSYDEAVSLLQYCRLVAKLCQAIPNKSEVLEGWIVTMASDLRSSKLRKDEPINYQTFQSVIESAYKKYRKEYKNNKQAQISLEMVLRECQGLLQKNKKHKQLIIEVGNETLLLKQSLTHPLKLIYFAKNNKIGQYLQ